jgi:hypothetical protein
VATEPWVLCSSTALPTVSSRDVCVAMEPTGAAGAATAVNCTCRICGNVYYKCQRLNNITYLLSVMPSARIRHQNTGSVCSHLTSHVLNQFTFK